MSLKIYRSRSLAEGASPIIDYQLDCLVFHVFEIHFKILFDFSSKEFWFCASLSYFGGSLKKNVFEMAKSFEKFLINHQFEVNRSYSVSAVVSDVVGPGFALNVDDDAS